MRVAERWTCTSYGTPSGFGVGLLAFLPQLLSLVTISLAFGRDLPFALFALTTVFVIFNKVCTAQVRDFDRPTALATAI